MYAPIETYFGDHIVFTDRTPQLQCLFDLTYVNRKTYLPLFASNTSADIFTYEFICEALPKRQFTVWLNWTTPRIRRMSKKQRTKFQSWSKSFDCILIYVFDSYFRFEGENRCIFQPFFFLFVALASSSQFIYFLSAEVRPFSFCQRLFEFDLFFLSCLFLCCCSTPCIETSKCWNEISFFLSVWWQSAFVTSSSAVCVSNNYAAAREYRKKWIICEWYAKRCNRGKRTNQSFGREAFRRSRAKTNHMN